MSRLLALFFLLLAIPFAGVASAAGPVVLTPTGGVTLGGAEISAFDAKSKRAFVTDAGANALHVVDLANPAAPSKIATVDLSPYGAGPNSVAVSPEFGGLVAVAVESDPKTSPGSVVLFDRNGNRRGNIVAAGALPDMLTFTPDGRTLLVANEGEPNDLYTVDPEGSVTVVDFDRGIGNPRVRTARFAGVPLLGPVRLSGFNSPTPAQDLEPESIATDGTTAWVTLQENNAIGLLNVASATFTSVRGLGFKDHGIAGQGMDASDRDPQGGPLVDRIFPRPGVKGIYMPDAIAAFRSGGNTLLVTANEGDARVYPTVDIPGGPDEGDIFSDETRVNGLAGLGYTFGSPLLGNTGNAALGRLTVVKPSLVGVSGLAQQAGSTLTDVYAFGGRSMSVWNANAALVADTGDRLERLAFSGNGSWFAGDRNHFNMTNESGSPVDDRSDNKGPEPEGVAIGLIGGTPYSFLGAERSGAIYAFDLTSPGSPTFAGFANTRPADLGPEGIVFVPASTSPNGTPLVLVTNEISGTLNVLSVTPRS